MSVYIQLKNGNFIEIPDLMYITYPDSDGSSVTVKEFGNFYLYHNLLTFVGVDTILSIDSEDIQFIKFYD